MNGPAPAPGASPSDLTARFRRLIRQSGPISLLHYFGESNAHYYASRDPLGAAGDFTTAPEISQMFGEMIGLWCADFWQRSGSPDIAYAELGPGRGTLAKDALRAMSNFGLTPPVHFVEGSPALREVQSGSIASAQFHDSLDSLPGDVPLLVIANEFFDALPVRQLVKTEAGWRERMAGLAADDKFVFVAGDKPMDAAVPDEMKAAATGTLVEVCPGAAAWAGGIAERLEEQGGAALFIDYGYFGERTGSSLQAVRAHAKVDPLEAPGTADLTAHVAFSALEAAMRQNGCARFHADTQGAFLERLGITARAQALAAADPARAQAIAGEHRRLLAPDAMGELFKVMAVAASGERWAEPAGFG